MPPKKIFLKTALMREHKNKSPPKSLIDVIQFAFPVIITGSTFSEAESLFLWNNIIPPSESTFYRVQKKITEAIVEMAKESCLKWKLSLRRNTCISFDGSWSHRRNALYCLEDFIDVKRNKVIDFEVVSKKCGGYGDFIGPSNAMEGEGLRKMIPRWINNKNISLYVHDKDAKTAKIIRDSRLNIIEFI